MENVTYKTEDLKNQDGTRTYIIYKNGEWNASYTSIDNEGYFEFMTRISYDVKKQTNGQIETV